MFDKFAAIVPSLDVAFGHLSVNDYLSLALFTLWIVVLAVPLIGIQREDLLTAAMYFLFILASGCILVIGIPHSLEIYSTEVNSAVGLMAAMLLAAFLRWGVMNFTGSKSWYKDPEKATNAKNGGRS